MKKYTAIYVENWLSGSHMQYLTKYKRIEVDEEKESVMDVLDREEIGDQTVYLFVGHPKLQGEEEE